MPRPRKSWIRGAHSWRWTGIAIWQHLATDMMPHAAGPGRTSRRCSLYYDALTAMRIPPVRSVEDVR